MLFSINRQYRWNLGFAHRDWRLTTGTEFDIVFSIDGGQAIYTTGRAVQSNHAIIRLADSMDLFDRFRRGHMLRIAADSRVFSFGLEGTAAMLAQLHDCVRRHTQPANVANASNGKRRTGPTSSEMIESPTLQAEAAVLLANVMAAANVNRYSIGTPEEASKASVHALWTAPSVVGSLLIIPTRRIDDPEIPGDRGRGQCIHLQRRVHVGLVAGDRHARGARDHHMPTARRARRNQLLFRGAATAGRTLPVCNKDKRCGCA